MVMTILRSIYFFGSYLEIWQAQLARKSGYDDPNHLPVTKNWIVRRLLAPTDQCALFLSAEACQWLRRSDARDGGRQAEQLRQ